jgi:hypothetical protein
MLNTQWITWLCGRKFSEHFAFPLTLLRGSVAESFQNTSLFPSHYYVALWQKVFRTLCLSPHTITWLCGRKFSEHFAFPLTLLRGSVAESFQNTSPFPSHYYVALWQKVFRTLRFSPHTITWLCGRKFSEHFAFPLTLLRGYVAESFQNTSLFPSHYSSALFHTRSDAGRSGFRIPTQAIDFSLLQNN